MLQRTHCFWSVKNDEIHTWLEVRTRPWFQICTTCNAFWYNLLFYTAVILMYSPPARIYWINHWQQSNWLQLALTIRSKSCTRWQSDVGTDPTRGVSETSKCLSVVNAPSSEGIVPSKNWFPEASNSWRWAKTPNSEGKTPVKRLCPAPM